MAFMFGSGVLFGVPSGENPTPRQFGTLQESSIEFSGSNKELTGQNQFAAAVARGVQKIAGKAKSASISVATYNALYFNETIEVGQNLAEVNKEYTIDATAGTIKPTKGTFLQDLGLMNENGVAMERVASTATPKDNQYKLDESNGTYTFADTMKGKNVYLSHLYHEDTTGSLITINNQLMGEAPTFKGIFNGRFSGKQTTLILNNCISSKLTLIGTKTEDFTIPEFDFSAAANAVGKVGTLSSEE